MAPRIRWIAAIVVAALTITITAAQFAAVRVQGCSDQSCIYLPNVRGGAEPTPDNDGTATADAQTEIAVDTAIAATDIAAETVTPTP
jgi:hypothetical protein